MIDREKLSHDEKIKMVSRHLAELKFSDKDVSKLSEIVLNKRFPVLNYDICKYGICWDFEFAGPITKLPLDELLDVIPGRVRNVDILVNGVVDPDRLRVRVGHDMR